MHCNIALGKSAMTTATAQLDLTREQRSDSARGASPLLWLGTLGYALGLGLCYPYVSELWNYQGFGSNLSIGKLIFSSFLLCTFLFFFPRIRMVARVAAAFNLGLVLVPSLILFSFNDLPWKFVVVTGMAVAILQATSVLAPAKRFKIISLSDAVIVRLLTAIAVINLLGIVYFAGFSRVNFDLFRVYDFREEAASVLPAIFGYLNAFTNRAAVPFILVLGLRDRKYKYVVLAFAIAVGFFAFTANRLPLFQPFLLVALYYLMAKKRFESWLMVSLLGIAFLGLVSFLLSPGQAPTFGTLGVYRALLIPMLLDSQYIEYFGNYGDYFYWAGSKLSLGLVAAPDTLPMINLIGAEYWSSQYVTANVGWIGSGYGHAGIFGVILYSILFGLLLALIQGFAQQLGHRTTICLMALPIVVGLTSSDFVPLFLSQGMGAALIMLAALRAHVSNIDEMTGKVNRV